MYGFADVPEGERYLLYDGRYIVNPATTVDLSAHLVGRSGVAVTDGGTFLNLTMTGAAAYPFMLELVDLTAGVYGSGYESGLTSAQPSEGEVPTLMSFDHRQALGVPLAPLPDTAKGDVVRLTMLERETPWLGGAYRLQYSLTRSATLDTLVMVDHSSTAATSAFEVKGVAESVSLDWRLSDFWALALAVHPQTQFDSLDLVYIKAMPYMSTEGYFTDAPNLFYLSGRSNGDKSNIGVDAGFMNPYPPSWSRVVYASQCFFAPEVVVVPGNAEDAGVVVAPSGCIQRVELASSIEGQPISPVLSPPTAFQVEAASPYQPHALSSLTPTVSWSPPTQGVPSQYNLSLSRVLTDSSSDRLHTVAVFSTAGTSIVVPPGVLESGQPYIFRLEAYSNPACSSAAPYPYRRAFPEHSAQTTSSVLRAP